MRRLLVTGGAGFIGANFVHYWLKKNPGSRLVVLDALTYAGNLGNLAPVRDRAEFRFVHGSIGDTDLVAKLLADEELDTVVHFAAESHVDRSITGPDAFIETNVVGTHSLLKAARRVWLEQNKRSAHRFHHVSTDEVYGSLGPQDPAFTELTPYAPNSPYSASKAASDHLVRAYHHTYGLNCTTSNCSNNFGIYHFPEKLIPLCILNILEGRPLPIYGDGLNVRDWLYVDDHCAWIDTIIAHGVAGETYNVGGGAERTNIDLIRQLCDIADAAFAKDSNLARQYPGSPCAQGRSAQSLITFVRDRPGHDRRYAIDSTKASKLPQVPQSAPLESSLRRVFEWYAANQPWWRAVLNSEYRSWIELNYANPAAAEKR